MCDISAAKKVTLLSFTLYFWTLRLHFISMSCKSEHGENGHSLFDNVTSEIRCLPGVERR